LPPESVWGTAAPRTVRSDVLEATGPRRGVGAGVALGRRSGRRSGLSHRPLRVRRGRSRRAIPTDWTRRLSAALGARHLAGTGPGGRRRVDRLAHLSAAARPRVYRQSGLGDVSAPRAQVANRLGTYACTTTLRGRASRLLRAVASAGGRRVLGPASA